MKKIQRKLREILGNAGVLSKHLACGNLPNRSDVTAVWEEASGIIYNAHLVRTLIPNTVSEYKVFTNPYGLEVSAIVWGSSLLMIKLTGVPESAKIESDKLLCRFTEYDNLGEDIVAVYSIQSIIYQSDTATITVSVSIYNLLTGTGVGLNIHPLNFGLEIKAY